MLNGFKASVIVLVAALTFSPLAFAQNAQLQHSGAAKDQKATAAPAAFHDISRRQPPLHSMTFLEPGRRPTDRTMESSLTA